MFKVNDYIVYGLNGVCKVEDIEKISLSRVEHEYYILSPVYNNKMTIKIPVNNKALSLRKLMTKGEVEDLIELFAKNEILEIEDTRKKVQEYKAIIKSGVAEEVIKVINSIRLEENEKASLGKKLNKTDEDLMISAKKQLFEEIAIVLNIDIDEVGDYIKNKI